MADIWQAEFGARPQTLPFRRAVDVNRATLRVDCNRDGHLVDNKLVNRFHPSLTVSEHMEGASRH